MIDFIDLTVWKTKKQILKELREQDIYLDERAWRSYVENHNKRCDAGLCDTFIAHSPKGYKVTKDKEEIKKAAEDYRKRGLNMLKKSSQAYRIIGDQIQIKLDDLIER